MLIKAGYTFVQNQGRGERNEPRRGKEGRVDDGWAYRKVPYNLGSGET
jgi:hypothetical protein